MLYFTIWSGLDAAKPMPVDGVPPAVRRSYPGAPPQSGMKILFERPRAVQGYFSASRVLQEKVKRISAAIKQLNSNLKQMSIDVDPVLVSKKMPWDLKNEGIS